MPLAPLEYFAQDGLVHLQMASVPATPPSRKGGGVPTLGMGMGASLVDFASVSPSKFLIRTERSMTSLSGSTSSASQPASRKAACLAGRWRHWSLTDFDEGVVVGGQPDLLGLSRGGVVGHGGVGRRDTLRPRCEPCGRKLCLRWMCVRQARAELCAT